MAKTEVEGEEMTEFEENLRNISNRKLSARSYAPSHDERFKDGQDINVYQAQDSFRRDFEQEVQYKTARQVVEKLASRSRNVNTQAWIRRNGDEILDELSKDIRKVRIGRDAITGEFRSLDYCEENPTTTIIQEVVHFHGQLDK